MRQTRGLVPGENVLLMEEKWRLEQQLHSCGLERVLVLGGERANLRDIPL
jgi:hypothetical protein